MTLKKQFFCYVIYRTMSLTSLFVGAPSSKYAAVAILAAVVVVSFTLLFGKDPIPFTQKMAFVLLLFLISLPGILLTLFQMTCLVTGAGLKNQRWWCAALSWILSILFIVYSVMLIVVSVVSLTTGEKVLSEIALAEAEGFENKMKEADKEAKQYFVGDAVAEPVAEGKLEDEKVPKDDAAKFTDASEPAATDMVPTPEGFDDAEVEMFTSCSAPF